ncbi:MAG: porin family protein [Saprospiraceae bacterium]
MINSQNARTAVAVHTSPGLVYRLFLLAALSVLTLTMLSAQSAFYLGTQAGINGSKFRYTEDLLELYPTSERLPGVNVGIDAGFQLGQWSFATGLQYVQKGSNYQTDTYTTEEGENAYFFARERLHFVSVPVLLGYSDYLTNRIGYKVQAGPSFNFGITGRIDETTEYFGSERTDFENYKIEFGNGVNDDYRANMVGFQFSPSLFFDLDHKNRLTLNATWDLGTKDSFNPSYKSANNFFQANRGTLTNRMAAITVGYQYRIPFADRY